MQVTAKVTATTDSMKPDMQSGRCCTESNAARILLEHVLLHLSFMSVVHVDDVMALLQDSSVSS